VDVPEVALIDEGNLTRYSLDQLRNMITMLEADLGNVDQLVSDWQDVGRRMQVRRQLLRQMIHKAEIRCMVAYTLQVRENVLALDRLVDAQEGASGMGHMPAHRKKRMFVRESRIS
jgi:hypothetical protein